MTAFKYRVKTEREYFAKLREVAREIDKLVQKYYDPLHPEDTFAVEMALNAYAGKLKGWARKAAIDMIKNVNFFNVQDFKAAGERISELFSARLSQGDPVFTLATELMERQVELIQSLPLQAAQRAQRIAQQARNIGARPESIIKKIQDTGAISWRRARTIARTEVARANSTLTQARAESVGVTHFIWHTMEDENVRSAHAKLDGKVFAFASPPIVKGEGAILPSQVFNCRCYAEPIFTNVEG